MNIYKKYYTIRNGGDNKYEADIQKSKITITDLESKKKYEVNNYKQVFIGKNSKEYGPYKKPFIGSSIVIELKDLEYVYVCDTIFKFKTIEPINKYHSQMGNGFVVYPFALTENYAYVIKENVYIKRDFGDIDPYEVYYDFKHNWNRKPFKFVSKKINLK